MTDVQVLELLTHDPEVAHQALNDVYTPNRPMQFSGQPTEFTFEMRVAGIGEFGSDHLRHTMATHAVTDAYPGFLTATVLGGNLRFAAGGQEVRMRRGDSVRYPIDAPLDCSWDDIDLAITRVPTEAIERAALLRSGQGPDDFHFLAMEPVSDSAAQQWRTLVAFARQCVNAADGALTHPIVLTQLVDLLASTALSVFPNTTVTATYAGGPGAVGPSVVRRAMAYIEEHAGRPITITDIAAAARVSPRAVQAGFRRHLGTTPLAYLRRVRLHRAHQDLQQADPSTGATVREIALSWGFAKSDRFAAAYRDLFGVLPSHTLRG